MSKPKVRTKFRPQYHFLKAWNPAEIEAAAINAAQDKFTDTSGNPLDLEALGFDKDNMVITYPTDEG